MLEKRQKPPDPDRGWWLLVVYVVATFVVMLALAFGALYLAGYRFG